MYYILKDKIPVRVDDVLEWASNFELVDRVVKRTELPEGIVVSTVFLGIDYRFGPGEPILFETMIFGGEHDEAQWRYSTWEEAEAGHQEAIELIYQVS